MATYTKIKAEKVGAVLRLVLNVPERRNAIGPQMVGELLHALHGAATDDAVRVVVVTGEGKGFSAGGDFQQMTGGADGGDTVPPGDYAELLQRMVRFEKPIVARVNGHAMGGGLGLVAASHFAVATEEAKLGTPEIEVGLFPFMIMAVLVRFVPRRRIMEMMLLGQKVDAKEALSFGLVNRVVPAAQLDAAVDALCTDLASRSPTAMRLGLRAFAEQDDVELEKALPMLRDRLAEALGTEDAREGLTAFLEKRTPNWTGK